jgi:hypothetical protein
MKAPEKKGMWVEGKPMDLENYILNVLERPLPQPPTHYVLVDILITDLSVKRVTIYYNPKDTWSERCGYPTAQSVAKSIGDGLYFLNRDPNTLAYKFWALEVATNNVIYKGSTYSCTKCSI